MTENSVNNYYQGLYITETINGNPNGSFLDNAPRNVDGKVYTTDKCIKYNVRNYIHNEYEQIEKKEQEDEESFSKNYKNIENYVFFYPRHGEKVKNKLVYYEYSPEAKYLTRNDVYEHFFDKDFNKVLEKSVDINMFGGTFSFSNENKQIYGPIQISYGIDINNAKIIKDEIGSPFSTNTGKQKTYGSQYIVDDAIIVYDLFVNPNNYPNLLKIKDFELFKEALWFGTNNNRTTSKTTVSKVLLLIKFKNEKINRDKISSFNLGELKEYISLNKNDNELEFITDNLKDYLLDYKEYIEEILIIKDKNVKFDISLNETGKSDKNNVEISELELSPKSLIENK